MNQQIPSHVADWCLSEGYTDPFYHEGWWWAFPPNGVMALRTRFPSAFPIFVHFGAIQQSIQWVNRTLELLNNGVRVPTTEELRNNGVRVPTFARSLVYANAFSHRSLTKLGVQSPIVDPLLSDQLSGAIHAARAGVEAFGLAANSAADSIVEAFRPFLLTTLQAAQAQKLAEHIATAIPTVLSAPEVPESPTEKAIELLVARFRMKRAIARLRLTEFCDRHSLNDLEAYCLLSEGKIRVKHGVLLCISGFPKKRDKRNGLHHP